MKTNRTKKTKVLVIEDEAIHFYAIKHWLENLDYITVPENFDEMGMVIDDLIGFGIVEFVQKQLRKHYQDIGLILCDIRFGNDSKKGYKIVKHIREFKNLSPSYWTSIVPIFCMTNYADINTIEDGIISAGADFVFRKNIIFSDLKGQHDNSKNEAITYKTIINSQVEKFQKSLKLFYPRGLEDEIIQFKDKQKNKKTAYIMTSFQDQNMSIANEILLILNEYNIRGYIANTQRWMSPSEIWDSIQVFMHGCDFGIAIYADESILKANEYENKPNEHEKASIRISPNLSQEVGYMLGLQKEICILKHQEMERVPSDLAEMYYVEFTNENLKEVFINWLENRQIID